MLMITKKIAMNKEVCKITNMMITLTYMELIGQYDENKLLFWAICKYCQFECVYYKHMLI